MLEQFASVGIIILCVQTYVNSITENCSSLSFLCNTNHRKKITDLHIL